ncbi:MAG: endonuclease/exonuclease/phosphatase family protein [Phycisphaeraceae bacterium]
MSGFEVMSFNVRVAVAADGVNAWDRRAALNTAVIQRHAPDLLGFQELQDPHWQVYEDALPEYERLRGPAYNNEPANYAYPAIFWNPHRFELIDHGGFWLSPTPEQHSMGWDTACVRSATWARLRRRTNNGDGGGELVMLNTHLDHRGEQARCEGAKLIVDRLGETFGADTPMIVTGDFNCTPRSDAYRTFASAGYGDAYLDAGRRDDDAAFTFHNYTGDRKLGRIDWILTRPGGSKLRASSARIIRDAEPPCYPSDHYPVQVRFALTP